MALSTTSSAATMLASRSALAVHPAPFVFETSDRCGPTRFCANAVATSSAAMAPALYLLAAAHLPCTHCLSLSRNLIHPNPKVRHVIMLTCTG